MQTPLTNKDRRYHPFSSPRPSRPPSSFHITGFSTPRTPGKALIAQQLGLFQVELETSGVTSFGGSQFDFSKVSFLLMNIFQLFISFD